MNPADLDNNNLHHKSIFKAGMIVTDLHRAMADIGAWLDVQWTPVRNAELALRTASGLEIAQLSFVCATGGGTILELIQAHPEGYYRHQPGAELHHVGMWVDDLTATSRQLEEQGMALEAAGVDGERSPALFAFHTNPYGLRIELVDAAMRPSFEQWLAGGDLDL